MSFLEVYLQLTLGIAPSNGFYQIPDRKALVLFNLTSEQAGAYDLVCTICATNLVHNSPLPECLRFFVAEVVTGKRKRPKGKKADKTWLANQYKFSLINWASSNFDLSMTRNEASSPESACDAVSEAFRRAGHGVDFYSLKRLCVEARYVRMRREAQLWALEVSKIGPEILAERYPVAQHFAPCVSDADDNGDMQTDD